MEEADGADQASLFVVLLHALLNVAFAGFAYEIASNHQFFT